MQSSKVFVSGGSSSADPLDASIWRMLLQLPLGRDLGRFSLLLGSVGANAELLGHPVPRLSETLSELSKNGLSRGRGAVFEKGILLAGIGAKLIHLGALGNRLI